MEDTVRATVEQDRYEVDAGDTVSVEITVQNLGIAVRVFSVEVEGLDESWWDLSSQSVSLFPGDRTSPVITITPPADSSALAKSYPVTVRVTSQQDPGEAADVSFSLSVLPFYSFTTDLAPQKTTGKEGSHTLSITNAGNTDVGFGLEGRDPEGLCTITFDPETPSVSPGATTEVTVRVEGKRPLRGASKSYMHSITVTPQVGTSEPASLQGEFEAIPRIPGWVLRVAILTVLAIAIGVALWRFVLYEAPIEVATLLVKPTALLMAEGATIQLGIEGTDADGNVISPEKMKKVNIRWLTDSETVVRVATTTGLATGVSSGSTDVWARVEDQGVESNRAEISVLSRAVASNCISYDPTKVRFAVDKGKLVLEEGGSVILTFRDEDDYRVQEHAQILVKTHSARCTIGEQSSRLDMMEFWSGSGNPDIEALIEPADCDPYDPDDLNIRDEENGASVLSSGTALRLRLPSRADSESALVVANSRSQVCFIGRNPDSPDPTDYLTQYWE